MRIRYYSLIAVGLVFALISPVLADWAGSMQIGGFTVNSISGTTKADGSGKATGKIAIPGDGSCQVDLVMNAAGGVTGSTRASFTISGVRIDGSLLLDRRGLQGTGIIYTSGRPITDANITVSAQSGLTANGKVNLGPGFAIPVSCDVSSRGVTVKGSSPRTATIDTPVAVYTFKGDVEVSSSGQAIKTTAKGSVERKGKVSGGVSSFDKLSCQLDPASGQGNLNVGGANIAIDLW